MQRKLVIYLECDPCNQPAADEPALRLEPRPSWAILNHLHIEQTVVQGDPLDLSKAAEEAEVILLVPAEKVLLLRVNLPKMSRSRLVQALPYALEEHLTEELDQLYFAMGPYQGDHHLPVAIVAHRKMQEWLALAKTWNIKVDRMIPLSLALPCANHTWHVMIDQLAVVRMGAYDGFACDRENLEELLTLALDIHPAPQDIHIHNYSQIALESSPKLQDKVNDQLLPPSQLMPQLARHILTVPHINLLQGVYAAKKSKFAHKNKLWRLILALALIWIGLLFSYPTISYLILKERLSQTDSDIAQIYKHHFPQASRVVAPKLRMEEKLQKTMTQLSQNRLLVLMGYTSKGLEKAPGIHLKRVDFQNNQLNLTLTAASSEEFSLFTDFLAQQGLKVKQQNARLLGLKVNAALVIE